MKNVWSLAVLWTVACAATAHDLPPASAPGGADAAPQIKAVGVAVVSKDAKAGLSALFFPGTTVSFMLTDPGKCFTSFDVKASRIESFSDDQGRNLMPPAPRGPSPRPAATAPASEPATMPAAASAPGAGSSRPAATGPTTRPAAPAPPPFAATPGFSPNSKLLGDSHQLVLQVFSPLLPGKAARELRIKGSLVVHYGLEQTQVQRAVQLVKGAKLAVGPLEGEIVTAGSYATGTDVQQTYVQLSGSKSTEAICGVTFIDASGKELETSFFAGSPPLKPGEPPNRRTIIINGNVRKGALKVTYFNRIETMAVPLDKTVSVGL